MRMQAPAGQAAEMHRRPPGRGRSRERAVRARGRDTVARLLAAGLAEFEERGLQAVTVSGTDSRLSAVACPIMLERANYLASSGVQLPRAELADRLTAIILAAFQAPGQPT